MRQVLGQALRYSIQLLAHSIANMTTMEESAGDTVQPFAVSAPRVIVEHAVDGRFLETDEICFGGPFTWGISACDGGLEHLMILEPATATFSSNSTKSPRSCTSAQRTSTVHSQWQEQCTAAQTMLRYIWRAGTPLAAGTRTPRTCVAGGAGWKSAVLGLKSTVKAELFDRGTLCTLHGARWLVAKSVVPF